MKTNVIRACALFMLMTGACSSHRNQEITTSGARAGAAEPSTTPRQTSSAAMPPFVQLVTGPHHTCGIESSKEMVRCWEHAAVAGRRDTGPFRVAAFELSGASVERIAVGPSMACALEAGGSIGCWLRLATGAPFSVVPATPPKVVDLAAGAERLFVLHADDTATWFARPAASDELVARGPLKSTDVRLVAANGDDFCVASANERVHCSGDVRSPHATGEVRIGPVKALAIGISHACALLPSGAVQCWGENGNGQLGNGRTEPSSTPVVVPGIRDAVRIDAQENRTCVATRSGRVLCWGIFGDGPEVDLPPRSSSPVLVENVTDAVDVAAGVPECALRPSGELACWDPDALSPPIARSLVFTTGSE